MRALSHRFGDLEVLHDVNLEVADGEFIAIVGPSGCGKSTVLRALAGLVVPTSGRIEIGGADVVGRPGSTAFLPQRDLLLPWRRALANATVGAEVGGIDRGEAESRAHDLFDRFGLRGFEEAWPHELSGGMRQRVAVLAHVLVTAARAAARRAIWSPGCPDPAIDAALVGRCLEDDRRSTILVTHDIEEALLLADRVLVMSGRPGRIVDEVQVGFPRPRELEITTDDDFVGLNKRVLSRLFADEK